MIENNYKTMAAKYENSYMDIMDTIPMDDDDKEGFAADRGSLEFDSRVLGDLVLPLVV